MAGETGAVLTLLKSARLSELESVVERCRASFIDAGEALREIRDGRLYRSFFGTFEDYCESRWDINRNYGNKLIRAADVVQLLGTTVPILPAVERQARELTRLEDPAQQVAAWGKVVERANGDARKVTAKVGS